MKNLFLCFFVMVFTLVAASSAQSASFQSIVGTPTGLWHEATVPIEGRDNVWYYGIDSQLNFDTAGRTLGDLTISVDVSSSDPFFVFDQIYESETGVTWDNMKIFVGSDLLWSRTAQKSADSSGDLAWETKTLDLSNYSGLTNIDFKFDSVDQINNDYLGWALDFDSTAPIPEPTTILLFGVGLLGIAGISRRRNQ